MNDKCPHIVVCGMPDFPGTKEVCTVHYECALGYVEPEDCPYGQEEEER